MWDTVPHPEPVARTPNPAQEGGQLLQLVDDAELGTSDAHHYQERNRPPGMYSRGLATSPLRHNEINPRSELGATIEVPLAGPSPKMRMSSKDAAMLERARSVMMERERARQAFHDMGQELEAETKGSSLRVSAVDKEEQDRLRRRAENMYVTRAESAVKLVVQERRRREEAESRMKESLHTWIEDHTVAAADDRLGLGTTQTRRTLPPRSRSPSPVATRGRKARSPSPTGRSRSPSPALTRVSLEESRQTVDHTVVNESTAEFKNDISKMIAMRQKRVANTDRAPYVDDGEEMVAEVKDEVTSILMSR